MSASDRNTIEKTLTALRALEMHNIFSISGDWPKAAQNTAVFDIDSVQLAGHIADLRARTGTPFFISCAVSPFKYQREDLLYQYLKLEKKIAAGADMAITQVGWDATKFVELKKYLDERGLKTPVLGNVYVLSRRAAERMNTGNPPGCWASDELVAVLKKESEAPDGGLQGRLERAAKTVAILKGIGYAGAYLGGTHDARHITQIIRRAEELAPRWEELFDELQFGKKDGFYLYKRDPQPKPTRTFLPTVMDAIGKAVPVVPWAKSPKENALRRVIQSSFEWLERHPRLSHWFERFGTTKKEVFGCQNCGNCVLGSMEYVCPQTCPKQMRNGPCGGTFHGACEVIDQECIWVKVMARAEASNTIDQLKVFVPPPDRRLTGTASWVNFYLRRDSRPGRPKDLWKADSGPGRTVAIEDDEELKTAGPSAADQAAAARAAKAPAPAAKSVAGGAGKVA